MPPFDPCVACTYFLCLPAIRHGPHLRLRYARTLHRPQLDFEPRRLHRRLCRRRSDRHLPLFRDSNARQALFPRLDWSRQYHVSQCVVPPEPLVLKLISRLQSSRSSLPSLSRARSSRLPSESGPPTSRSSPAPHLPRRPTPSPPSFVRTFLASDVTFLTLFSPVAFGGVPAFFTIVSEMRDPRLYTKAMLTCQGFVTSVYIVSCLLSRSRAPANLNPGRRHCRVRLRRPVRRFSCARHRRRHPQENLLRYRHSWTPRQFFFCAATANKY